MISWIIAALFRCSNPRFIDIFFISRALIIPKIHVSIILGTNEKAVSRIFDPFKIIWIFGAIGRDPIQPFDLIVDTSRNIGNILIDFAIGAGEGIIGAPFVPDPLRFQIFTMMRHSYNILLLVRRYNITKLSD